MFIMSPLYIKGQKHQSNFRLTQVFLKVRRCAECTPNNHLAGLCHSYGKRKIQNANYAQMKVNDMYEQNLGPQNSYVTLKICHAF